MNEIITSSKEPDCLVTFVGFRSDLVIEFFKPYLIKKNCSVKRIFIFYTISKTQQSSANKAESALNEISTYLKNFQFMVDVKTIKMKNMWDLKEYRSKLSEIKAGKASVNLTAGPAVFTLAGILWAIEMKHYIEHSVESYIPLVGQSIVYNRINIDPLMQSLFLVDEIDKQVIDFLRVHSRTTTEINTYLKTSCNQSLTLRTIENRINILEKKGIVSVVRNRVHKIYLSEALKKI